MSNCLDRDPRCFFLLDLGPNLLQRLLALNAPIATKVVCFSHLLKCLRSLYGKQCGPRVCSGSTLFASILNSSVMLGNYLQQTTFSDAFFFLALSGLADDTSSDIQTL